MQYMGQDTTAAGTVTLQADPEKWVLEAEEKLTGKPMDQALSMVSTMIASASMTVRGTKAKGPAYFTSVVAQRVVDQYTRAVAYVTAFSNLYGWENVEAAMPGKLDSLQTSLSAIYDAAQELMKWDSSVGDAMLILQQKKRDALMKGDINSPLFSKDERAYYQRLAATGQLSRNVVPVSQEVEQKIAEAKPRGIGVGMIAALAAAGVGVFLLTR